MKPASNASFNMFSIFCFSSSLAEISSDKERLIPIAFIRISECPIKEAMLIPNGKLFIYDFHSFGLFQVFSFRNKGSITSLGIASTLVKESAVSSGLLKTAETEQLPRIIVVTPCRADSFIPGDANSSAS